jgi:hypothetical protein
VLQGIYDIERIPRPPAVAEVPLETCFPPGVTLRYDDAGHPVAPVRLGPTFSDVGYITSPPLALTTLESGAWLSFQRKAPISAIRVRVAGVDEFTPEAQARVETVAAGIIERTGLAVDITVGSSPRRVLVRIPGQGPVPAVGYVEEGWVQKGLSYTLVRETKRIDVLLFSVMLVVSALYILNTTLISTLARRREIALHKALGWRTGCVFTLVLAEGLLVGVLLMGVAERRREIGVLKAVGWRDGHVFHLFLWDAAGLAVAGGVVGWVLGGLAYWGIYREIPVTLLILVLPALIVPLAVSLLAALYPAWQAAQVPPAEAVRYE